MSKKRTAFKHPKCGGIINQVDHDGASHFECDQCGASDNDINALILRGLVIIRKATRKRSTPE